MATCSTPHSEPLSALGTFSLHTRGFQQRSKTCKSHSTQLVFLLKTEQQGQNKTRGFHSFHPLAKEASGAQVINMDTMNFSPFICKSSIAAHLKHGQSPLIKQILVMGFKAMANQYITRSYARLIYALHNNQGNCTSGYICGDTLKPSPGHLRSSAGCSQVEIPRNKPR